MQEPGSSPADAAVPFPASATDARVPPAATRRAVGAASPTPNGDVPPLPWTGERFIPNEGGPEIYYEHAHRYLVAQAAVAGKAVVDLASGEGYGAAWLAEVAADVVGIDIDPVSVDHAAARYASTDNLRFAVGDIQRLPLDDGCADAVTCFEAIEHVSDPRLVVEEVTRILKPGGVFLVSTPNKAVYTDDREYTNEFHIHEFYLPDFERLLGEHFPERILFGQRLLAGSLLWSLAPEGTHEVRAGGPSQMLVSPGFDETAHRSGRPMYEPMYVLAVCRLAGGADADIAVPGVSVLVDPQDVLLDTLRRSLQPAEAERLVGQLRDQDLELERRRNRLEAQDGELERARQQLSEYERLLVELRAECVASRSERDAVLDRLAEEQGERADLLRRLHLEEDGRAAVAAELESERATGAAIRAERDNLLAELAGGRLAAERWAALERWQLVRLYRLAKRVLRRR
jgi:2-polyprenyl-3-methyl-5-hydroxy-6-metoxy-1,4-benzoquinol methylase